MHRWHPEFQDRCRELAQRWSVEVDESFETESSVIAYGVREGRPVVLKVVHRPGDEWKSGEVVRAFAGRGMVRALEYEDGAVLLERVVPGTALVDLTTCGRDDRATEILADVIAAMAPDSPPRWCPTVKDWHRGFARYLGTGDTQISADLVRRAGAMYGELCETQRDARLLHGDLQHYNILEDRERGWLAIDPKGVVGEVEYELGAALRNPVESPEVFTDAATVESRIAALSSRLRLDANRVLRWAFAQAVLSAIWQVEDGHTLGETNAPLALARALEARIKGVRVV